MINSTQLKYKELYQYVFLLAGTYNLLWGLISALYPQWFFILTGLPQINHPTIFACLGMVIGIYGLLYLEIARKPENGWIIAAIGLLGKILGPIGMIQLIIFNDWPVSAFFYMCLSNDLIWWIPFSSYLYHSWPEYKASFKKTK